MPPFVILVALLALGGAASGCTLPCECLDDGAGRVVMNCASMELKSVPAVPSNVSVLIMSGNALVALNALSFPDTLSSLEELLLQSNEIAHIEGEAFLRLPGLRRLYLSNNRISRIENNTFNGLTSLQELYLDFNRISSIEKGALASVAATLLSLNLDSNPLTALDQSLLAGAASLTFLTIMDGYITSLPDSIFADCSKLTRLFLGKQFIQTLSDSTFLGLSSLRVLALNSNKLTELRPSWFAPLTSLTQLGVRGNLITGFPSSSLSSISLKSITTLQLLDNNVRDIPQDMFSAYPNLAVLEMTGNPSDCAIVQGELSCSCANGRTGPTSSASAASNIKQSRFCVADACTTRPRKSPTEACVAAGTCWVEEDTVHESNVCKCAKHRVDCTALGIKELPSGIPASTAQLFLFMNELTVFPNLLAFQNLYLVDVRSNRIDVFPEAHRVLPPSFWPLHVGMTFNMSADPSLAEHARLEPMVFAGTTHTFGPTAVIPGLAFRAASFTGKYAFGGVGTIGNPSKCTFEYTGGDDAGSGETKDRDFSFECSSCAAGHENIKGTACTAIAQPPTPTLTLASASSGPDGLLTNVIPIVYNLSFDFPVTSSTRKGLPLALGDLIISGLESNNTVMECTGSQAVATSCSITITPSSTNSGDRVTTSSGLLVIVLPRGAAVNAAGLSNTQSVSHSVYLDAAHPAAELSIKEASSSALSGEEPATLVLRFSDGPVEMHPLDLAAALEFSSSIGADLPSPTLPEAPRRISDDVWEIRVLLPSPAGLPSRNATVTIALPRGAIADTAGNKLTAGASVTVVVSAVCAAGEKEVQPPTWASSRTCAEAEAMSSDDGDERDWLFWLLVIGVPVLAVLLLAIAVLILCCVRRRYRRPFDFEQLIKEMKPTLFQPDVSSIGHRDSAFSGSGGSGGSIDSEMSAMLSARKSMLQSIVAPKEIQRRHLRLLKVVGEGFFGEVHLGELSADRQVTPVAVKMSKRAENTRAIMEEAVVMAQVTHPNIVQLIGVVTSGMPIYIVSEYAANGSLDKFLRAHATGIARLSLDTQLQVVSDILCGMAYIESIGLIHRDLAARNVLLDGNFKCKISDFGLARFGSRDDDYYVSEDINALPVRWMAPEALQTRKYSSSSDVWAFGITVFEIFSFGRTPYEGWTNTHVWNQVLHGFRLFRPPGMPEGLHSILVKCWSSNRKERPSFYALKKRFASGELSVSSPATRRRLDSELAETTRFSSFLATPDTSVSVYADDARVGGGSEAPGAASASPAKAQLSLKSPPYPQGGRVMKRASSDATVIDFAGASLVQEYKPHEYVDLVDWVMPDEMMASRETVILGDGETPDSTACYQDRSQPSDGYIIILGSGDEDTRTDMSAADASGSSARPMASPSAASTSVTKEKTAAVASADQSTTSEFRRLEEAAIAEEELRLEEEQRRIDAELQELQAKLKREKEHEEREKAKQREAEKLTREREEKERREREERERKEAEAEDEQRRAEERVKNGKARREQEERVRREQEERARREQEARDEESARGKPKAAAVLDDDEEEERKRRRRKERELEAKAKAEQADKGPRKWELKRREEEQQREDELKRLEEVARAREEARRKEEEEQRRAEERWREEAKRKDELKRQKDQGLKSATAPASGEREPKEMGRQQKLKADDDRRKREEELRQMEEEMRKQEEELKRVELEMEQQRLASSATPTASSLTVDDEAFALESELAHRERERAARRAARKAKEDAVSSEARSLVTIAETPMDEALALKQQQQQQQDARHQDVERAERRAARKAAAELELQQQQQQQQRGQEEKDAPRSRESQGAMVPGTPVAQQKQGSSTSDGAAARTASRTQHVISAPMSAALATSTPINASTRGGAFSHTPDVSPLGVAASTQPPARRIGSREGDQVRPLRLDSAGSSGFVLPPPEAPRALPRRKTTGDKRPTLGSESGDGASGIPDDDGSELRELMRRRERRSEKRS